MANIWKGISVVTDDGMRGMKIYNISITASLKQNYAIIFAKYIQKGKAR